MLNNDLLEQYKNCIRKAHEYEPHEKAYLEYYKKADMLEKRIKTEVVKVIYQTVELQLDQLDQLIRQEKLLNKRDA
jgi:hypothetical protein